MRQTMLLNFPFVDGDGPFDFLRNDNGKKNKPPITTPNPTTTARHNISICRMTLSGRDVGATDKGLGQTHRPAVAHKENIIYNILCVLFGRRHEETYNRFIFQSTLSSSTQCAPHNRHTVKTI